MGRSDTEILNIALRAYDLLSQVKALESVHSHVTPIPVREAVAVDTAWDDLLKNVGWLVDNTTGQTRKRFFEVHKKLALLNISFLDEAEDEISKFIAVQRAKINT